MKPIATGNVVLCEFVAMGANNKHILVNTFSGDVVVNELPARINLGLYLEIIPDTEVDQGVIELDLVLGKSKFASVAVQVHGAKKSVPALIVLNQFHLATDIETTFKVVLRQTGYRSTTVLTKRIFQGPIPSPTSSPPPA